MKERRTCEIRNTRIPREIYDDVQRGIDAGYWLDHAHWWSFYLDRAIEENVWPGWLLEALRTSTLIEDSIEGDS